MNQRVGDLEGNATAILEMREQAKGADLLMCPELQLTGYPPEDLVLKPEFVAAHHGGSERLVARPPSLDPPCCSARSYMKTASTIMPMILADGGRSSPARSKRELPNYGTFDEKRVFTSGPLPEPIVFKGVKLGIPICEDIWPEVVCSPSRRGRRGAPAGAERQPVRARQG